MKKEAKSLLAKLHLALCELSKNKFQVRMNYCDNNMDCRDALDKEGATQSDNIIYFNKFAYEDLDKTNSVSPNIWLGCLTNRTGEIRRIMEFYDLDVGYFKDGDEQLNVKTRVVTINKAFQRGIC